MTILSFPEQSLSKTPQASIQHSLQNSLLMLKRWLTLQTDIEGELSTPCPLSAQFMISELLSLQGFNITRIALELEVSKATISRLWRGIIRTPHGKTMRCLVILYSATMMNSPTRKATALAVDAMSPAA